VGLGLAIVQRYLVLLRARLDVRGKVGQGTSFTVLVPYRSLPEDQVQAGAPATPRSRALRAA
jgi:signal transduction histidine kinase